MCCALMCSAVLCGALLRCAVHCYADHLAHGSRRRVGRGGRVAEQRGRRKECGRRGPWRRVVDPRARPPARQCGGGRQVRTVGAERHGGPPVGPQTGAARPVAEQVALGPRRLADTAARWASHGMASHGMASHGMASHRMTSHRMAWRGMPQRGSSMALQQGRRLPVGQPGGGDVRVEEERRGRAVIPVTTCRHTMHHCDTAAGLRLA